MDLRKLNYKKAFIVTIALTGVAGVLGGAVLIGRPLLREINSSFAMKEFRKFGVIETYRKRYHLFFEKVDQLATADLHEEFLMRELAETRRDLEVEKAKTAEIEFRNQTKKIASHLKKKTGSHLARIPDGIEYEVPTTMQSYQLMVLGMEYFRKHDFEKSAMIFHDLMSRQEEQKYRRADHYLVTAISWYKLKHFEMASQYLELAEKNSTRGDQWYRQALLWKSMVRKSLGDNHGSQNLLTRLISYHPDSEEAALVNGMRKPASHAVEPEDHAESDEHAEHHAKPAAAHDTHGHSGGGHE